MTVFAGTRPKQRNGGFSHLLLASIYLTEEVIKAFKGSGMLMWAERSVASCHSYRIITFLMSLLCFVFLSPFIASFTLSFGGKGVKES